MGSAQSIPQSLPSSQSYKGKVIPTQVLVNEIFSWMMSQMDTNDLLKLANPKYCKEYVFLTQESLKSFFRDIQLEPKLRSKNVLYFEQVKKLTFADEQAEKNNPQMKQYRDILCRQLAFFYVRIFQIYGAMALTVIDSLPEAEVRAQDVRQAAVGRQPFGRPPPGFAFGPMRGGKKVDEEDRPILGSFYDKAGKYFSRVSEPGKDPIVYAILETVSKYGRGISQGQRDTIYFQQNGDGSYSIYYLLPGDTSIDADIAMSNITSNGYTLILDNIEYKGESLENLRYDIPMVLKGGNEFRYVNSEKTFYSVLKTIISKIPYPREREKSLDEILGQDKREGPGAGVARREERVDEQGIPEGLSYLKIRDYLKEKPKAYCVARAIQLLSPTLIDGLRKDIPFESDICFFDNPPAYMKDSVPLYNNAITSNSPGLRALNQLFFDMLDGNVPRISAETKPRYQQFVDMMQVIFSPQIPAKQVATLDKVQSVPLPDCGTSKENPNYNRRLFLTTKNSVREVQKTVALLLNYQMKHTAVVTKFLLKLFLVDKQGRIRGFNTDLLKGGIPYVNKLSEEARGILTEYYKYCEGTYRLGALQVLSDSKKIPKDRI